MSTTEIRTTEIRTTEIRTTEIRTVAFIGLGNMGTPMARCLHKAGFALTLFDLDPALRDDLAGELKVVAASTAAEAAKDADCVITMVPNGEVVRALLQDDGVAAAMPAGSVLIDMSSSDPMGTRNLGAWLMERGIDMLDAPVSGGVRKAIDGSLAIMVGGADTVFEQCQPILNAMGGNLFHAGDLGSGHAIKALNNYVSAAGLVAAVEALRMGMAFGIEPDKITEILNASTGRNNTTENKLKQHIASGSYASGFSLGLMQKDIKTAVSLGPALGVDATFGAHCLDYWTEALNQIGPDADHTAVVDKPDKASE